MDLKDAEKQIDNADSFLDKLWKFLGKHWGKLLILLLLYGAYKFCVLVAEEMDKEQSTPAATEQPVVEPTVSSEYYLFEDEDTLVVRNWSDGVTDTINIKKAY